MFARERAECPFCGSEQFTVKLLVNDMPLTHEPSEMRKELTLACASCGKKVFQVDITRGGQVSAIGAFVCERCEADFHQASGQWCQEDIPKITYPVGTRHCPRCGGQLKVCWWRGWNYTI